MWGTTYLAIRIGALHYPAFLFAGVRQTISGIILMPIALMMSKKKDLSPKNILRQMLIGFFLLTVGNGCVTWGEKYIPSGIAALICSIMPIFAVGFNLLSSKKEHFSATIGLGMFLGICGVGLIFRHNIADLSNPLYLAGILSVLLATCTWAFGSIMNKKHADPVNPMFNSGLQLFFGGVFMLIVCPWTDDLHHIQIWQPEALFALGYLIIFGSVLAYAAYMYALSALQVGIATIYAYINPLIAVIVGYIALGESLNIYTALAFITIAAGVYIVNKGYRAQHKKQQLISEGGDTEDELIATPQID